MKADKYRQFLPTSLLLHIICIVTSESRNFLSKVALESRGLGRKKKRKKHRQPKEGGKGASNSKVT
jgi:hypothetical protein